MLRMSQRTWNNVLIFIVIAMILALNIDKFTADDGSRARLVVAEGEFILNLSINQVVIEKAGQQWRINRAGVQPSVQPTTEQLQSLVSAWQQTYITPAGIEFDARTFDNPDSLVVIELAGNPQAIVVAFKIVEDQLFLILDKQVYILNSPSITALLEPIVDVKI